LRQHRLGGTALLVKQGGEDMHGFEHVVVAPHGQALGIGQGLLESRCEFVHAHGWKPSSSGGRMAEAP